MDLSLIYDSYNTSIVFDRNSPMMQPKKLMKSRSKDIHIILKAEYDS